MALSQGSSDLTESQPTAGQNSNFIDHLFTGNFLGHESDIADGRLRGWEFRSFAHLVGDYYVSPRFMDAIAVRALQQRPGPVAIQRLEVSQPLGPHARDGRPRNHNPRCEVA
jgi:hypothetical protein